MSKKINACFALAFPFAMVAAIPVSQGQIPVGSTGKVPPTSIIREKVEQWVEVQTLQSKEAAEWAEQKRLMADLNELRRKEISQIDSLIEAAGKRLSEAVVQRDGLLAEKASLRVDRELRVRRLGDVEISLRQLLPQFPHPLKEKVSEEIVRIQAIDPSRSLQGRFNDVVAILGTATEFGRTLTIANEMRRIGEENVEVEVLYLGFSAAWYIGRDGNISGHGWGEPDGWFWMEDKSVADPLREAIEMYQKERVPGYVTMHFGKRDRVQP